MEFESQTLTTFLFSHLPDGCTGRYLNTQLSKNQVIHDGNKDLIVEVLRSVAELMIWGDQHNPAFFECVPNRLANRLDLLKFFF